VRVYLFGLGNLTYDIIDGGISKASIFFMVSQELAVAAIDASIWTSDRPDHIMGQAFVPHIVQGLKGHKAAPGVIKELPIIKERIGKSRQFFICKQRKQRISNYASISIEIKVANVSIILTL